MLSFLKELFCLHAYEYEQDDKGNVIKVCRKCGQTKIRYLSSPL
jgi:hypothetical protein